VVSWVLTYTGKQFDVKRPRLRDIDIRDIAHHLSLVCRFTGACAFHYSVAQHSLLVASQVPQELKLEALLHDASEAYLADVSRPVKKLEELRSYRDLDRRVQQAVFRRFGVRSLEEPHMALTNAVRTADNAALVTEGLALLPYMKGWNTLGKPLKVRIAQRTPADVEQEFLATWEELHHAR